MLGEASLIRGELAEGQAAEAGDHAFAAHHPAGESGESKSERVGGLVLTRHQGESIMIGDEVEVTVVGIKSGVVRFKVVAPRSIAVHRREVFDSIRSAPAAPAPVADPIASRPCKPGGGLVLARSARQSIMVGEDVELAVVEVRPSMVKVKVSAPRSVAVHRREVFEAIRDGFA